MKQNTVEYFRKNIGKVRVTSSRYLKDGQLLTLKNIRDNKLQNLINSRGGKVTVDLTTKDGKDYSVTAQCNLKDSFNKRISMQICLGRLAKLLQS